MKRYYFNLSRRSTYDELVKLGVDAETPEEAETYINNYLDSGDFPDEFIVFEREPLEDIVNTVTLIEDTEVLENDNDDEDPETA